MRAKKNLAPASKKTVKINISALRIQLVDTRAHHIQNRRVLVQQVVSTSAPKVPFNFKLADLSLSYITLSKDMKVTQYVKVPSIWFGLG